MKKRILTFALTVIYLLSGISMSAFAEEREYVLLGNSIGLKNQKIDVQKKKVDAMQDNGTERFSITSYNSTDDSMYRNRGVIIRYDISNVPADAGKVEVMIANTKRSGSNYTKLLDNDFIIGVYALENLNDTWELNTSWEDMIVEDIEVSDFRKNRVGEIDSSKDIYEIVGSGTNTPINGYGLKADITDYVVKKVKEGKSYVDVIFLPDSHGSDPDDHTELKLLFENVNYQYTSYQECVNFRPAISWYEIVKSEINTIENLTVENGYLKEEFIKDAVDNSSSLQKVYTVGVKDETKSVKLSYELSSIYATDEGAVKEGNIGDTLVIPVKSEAGITRTYKFELVSMVDAGYTEGGKITIEEFDYTDSTISAKIKNNSTDEKNAVIVVNELNNKKLSKINVYDYKLTPGYADITKEFNKQSSTTAYSMYIADKENIFAPLSSVITSSSTSFDKKDSVIEIYYKDVTKEELTASGKWMTGETSIITLVLNDGKKLSDYDGTNETEVFNYAAAMTTDTNGYYGFDVAMPRSDDYTIYVADGSGNSAELPIYYASVTEKEDALTGIYNAASEDDLKAKLNLSLTEEERKALEDKYNDTNGAEGQKDYVKILALDTECFVNGVSEDNFIKLLYKGITEYIDTSKFSEIYNEALIIASINSGVVSDIAEYNEKISISEDIMELYNDFSDSEKLNISSNKISHNNYTDFEGIKAGTEEQIVIYTLVKYHNKEIISSIINDYKDILKITDYMDSYNNLSSKKKEKVIDTVKDKAPYNTAEEFSEEFEDAVKKQNKKESSGSSGGSGSGSSSGMSQSFGVTGSVDKSNELTSDNINAKGCNFTDLTGYEWAQDAIKSLYAKGAVNGVSETSFNPSGEVKREEFVKMISILYSGDSIETLFTDVDKSAWYVPYINKAVASGVIKGINENEFGIGSGVTREDMAVMIYRILKGEKVEYSEAFTDDSNISDYAKNAVYYLKANNIVSGTGNGNYEPKRVMTRAEAAVVINNILKTLK